MADANIRAVITAEDHASRALSAFGNQINGLGRNTENAHGSFLKLGSVIGITAGIASNVFGSAIYGVSNLIGDAIKRVDTLGNASHVFSDMGFKTADTQKAMAALDKSIRGLPTSLNEAVTNVQLLAVATGDISKSQKIFSALNDAIIGTGGTAEDVKGSVVQLSQAFSNGKIDAQTWNSLIQNMGPALGAVAKSMGITMGALKDGLSNGTISVQQFQDALINMDVKGGGGMKSFRDMALDATSGIGTGFTNMKTSITRGLADIIKAVGQKNISNAISDIGKGFEAVAKIIARYLPDAIELIKKLFDWFSTIKDAIGNLVGKLQILWQQFTNSNAVKTMIQHLQQELWPALKAVASAIVDKLIPAWDNLKDALIRVWKAVNPALMDALKIIAAVIAVTLYNAILTAVRVINVVVQGFSFLIDIVSVVIDWISNLISWIGNFASKVMGYWDDVKQHSKNAADSITTAWRPIGDFLNRLWTDIKNAFLNAWDGGGHGIHYVIQEIADAPDKIKQAWFDLPIVLGKIFDSIKTNATNAFDGMTKAIKPWRTNFLGTLGTTLDSANKLLGDYIKTTIKSWGKWISSTADSFFIWGSTILVSLGGTLDRVGKTLSNFFKNLPKQLEKFAKAAVKNIVDYFASMPVLLALDVLEMGNVLVNFFAGLPKRIGGFVKGAVKSIGDFFSDLPHNINRFLDQVAGNISLFFSSLPGLVSGSVHKAGNDIGKNHVGGVSDAVKSRDSIQRVGNAIMELIALAVAAVVVYVVNSAVIIGGKFVRGIADGISSAVGLAWSAAQKVATTISGIFAGAAHWLVGAGRDVIWGLVNGMTGMIGTAANAAASVAKAALNAAKSALGVHSPSTVFMEIGHNVTAGFVKGINDTKDDAAESMKSFKPDFGRESSSSAPVQTTHQTIIHISPNIGVYAGTPTERRKLAMTLLNDMKDLASQKNLTVHSMLGGS